jgi:hypothetical protein
MIIIEFPLIAIHQLYIKKLNESTAGNGIFLPRWLFEKTGLLNGEKVILTREKCIEREVESIRNRSTTSVFVWDNDYVEVIGPTAKFLGSPGLSCIIAYGSASEENYVALDFNFPKGNKENRESDLVDKRYGENEFEEVQNFIEREVLAYNVSGLKVEIGDPFCNPHLAEIPSSILEKIEVPDVILSTYFSSSSKSQPALKSYLARSKEEKVAMSGALFGAFPVGDKFVIDIYCKVKGDYKKTHKSLHV